MKIWLCELSKAEHSVYSWINFRGIIIIIFTNLMAWPVFHGRTSDSWRKTTDRWHLIDDKWAVSVKFDYGIFQRHHPHSSMDCKSYSFSTVMLKRLCKFNFYLLTKNCDLSNIIYKIWYIQGVLDKNAFLRDFVNYKIQKVLLFFKIKKLRIFLQREPERNKNEIVCIRFRSNILGIFNLKRWLCKTQ